MVKRIIGSNPDLETCRFPKLSYVTIRMRFILLLLILYSFNAGAQETDILGRTIDTVIDDIPYRVPDTGWLEKFPEATIILDYYHSSGISLGDRIEYEIILVDTLLITGFSSPESDDYRYVEYQKRSLISQEQLARIKEVVKQAKVKSKNQLLPCPGFSGYGEQILGIKTAAENIVGGNVYSNVGSGEEDDLNLWTLEGNYTIVIKELERLFADLEPLRNKAPDK